MLAIESSHAEQNQLTNSNVDVKILTYIRLHDDKDTCERNYVLTMVGHVEKNTFSTSKVRYVHPNNATLINALPCP